MSATSRLQLRVHRHEDGAEAAASMGPQDAEPLPVGGGRAHDVAAGAVGVTVGAGAAADMVERGLDLRATGGGEALACRAVHAEGREAPLGVTPVELDVCVGQSVEQGPVLGVEGALLGQEVGQGFPGGGRPDGEGHDELVASHHPVLQRQQTEEQIAWGIVVLRHRFGSRTPAACEATCTDALADLGADTARRGPLHIIKRSLGETEVNGA